jgi:hypothetical protein
MGRLVKHDIQVLRYIGISIEDKKSKLEKLAKRIGGFDGEYLYSLAGRLGYASEYLDEYLSEAANE